MRPRSPVQVGALEHVEAGDLLFGLCERPIADQHLAAAHPSIVTAIMDEPGALLREDVVGAAAPDAQQGQGGSSQQRL